MPTLDIFNTDAFSLAELTAAVNQLDYVPGLLGELGVFEAKPVTTTSVWIEERGDALTLVPNAPRGAVPSYLDNTAKKRTGRSFRATHLPKVDRIYADEIQNVRAFGSQSELEQIMAMVRERQTMLRRDLELTWEYQFLNSLQGILKDANGDTIYNFWTEFELSQESQVDFELDDATTDVRAKCAGIVRTMLRNLKGQAVPGMRVVGLCSDGFYDDLIAHALVRDTYLNWQAAQDLRGTSAFARFSFGGIEFINYRGTDDETTVTVTADEAIFFPTGVPGLYHNYFAPADTIDFVNTPGLPFYSWITNPDNKRYVEVEVQSNPLPVCLQPKVLMYAKKA